MKPEETGTSDNNSSHIDEMVLPRSSRSGAHRPSSPILDGLRNGASSLQNEASALQNEDKRNVKQSYKRSRKNAVARKQAESCSKLNGGTMNPECEQVILPTSPNDDAVPAVVNSGAANPVNEQGILPDSSNVEVAVPAIGVNGGANNLVDEQIVLPSPNVEVTVPPVNEHVLETNRHTEMDIKNSVFSQLQSYKEFVPASSMLNANTVESSNNGPIIEDNSLTEDLEPSVNVELSPEEVPVTNDCNAELASNYVAFPAYAVHMNYMLTTQNPFRPDYANSSHEATYCESMVSDDSGRGPSESPHEVFDIESGADNFMVYKFLFPSKLCGLMIGTNGKHVKAIRAKSGAKVILKPHPRDFSQKICIVTGADTQVDHALKLIRKKFPEEIFPEVNFDRIENVVPPSFVVADTMKPTLPEGVGFDAVLSCAVTPGHFFLQQPTHPSYYQMFSLCEHLTTVYATNTPVVENPKPGDVCVACMNGRWCRAEIIHILPDGQWYNAKSLDFGGYINVHVSQIRKMRVDFMSIPFQAIECILAGVEPVGEEWSLESKMSFESLTENQILRGVVVGYVGTTPCVYLSNRLNVTINQLLINEGFAKPIAIQE